MPKRSNAYKHSLALSWIVQKLDEHDKLLQDIFETLRELKQQTDLNNQKFILEVIQQYSTEEKTDLTHSPS